MGCSSCSNSIQVPSVKQAGKGVAALIKHAVGITHDASAEKVKARTDICRGCEHSTKNPDRLDRPSKGLTTLSQCKLCSCVIALKTKIEEQTCPEGKW